MIDILATMTPKEYRLVKAQLEIESLWNDLTRETESNRRAEQILTAHRK